MKKIVFLQDGVFISDIRQDKLTLYETQSVRSDFTVRKSEKFFFLLKQTERFAATILANEMFFHVINRYALKKLFCNTRSGSTYVDL